LSDNLTAKQLLNNASSKIVLKSSNGQCGEGMDIINLHKINKEELIKKLNETKNDIVAYIVILQSMMRLIIQ